MTLREAEASLSAWVDARPMWAPSRPVELPPEDDEQERDGEGLGDAEGQSFMIEYRDTKGRVSRRRITVWHISESSKDGVPFLYARCHERQAMRTFRVDRIACCIDYDGLVYDDVPRFLADTFGMAVWRASASEDASERRWRLITEAVRADATLLAAMSRSDGHMATSELEEIVSYLARLIEADGNMLSGEDLSRLSAYVRRLRPTADALRRALHAASAFQPERLKHMLLAAAKVMDADTIRHPAEVRLLNLVSAELLGVRLL